MSETPIHPTENQKDHFDDILEIQALDAARRMTAESHIEVQDKSEKKSNIRVTRFGKGAIAATLVVGGAIGAGAGLGLADRGPDFSEKTTTYTVQDGEGLYDAAKAVEGSEEVDQRDIVQEIKDDPANIDVLKDGLQANESIEIPVSVEK